MINSDHKRNLGRFMTSMQGCDTGNEQPIVQSEGHCLSTEGGGAIDAVTRMFLF